MTTQTAHWRRGTGWVCPGCARWFHSVEMMGIHHLECMKRDQERANREASLVADALNVRRRNAMTDRERLAIEALTKIKKINDDGDTWAIKNNPAINEQCRHYVDDLDNIAEITNQAIAALTKEPQKVDLTLLVEAIKAQFPNVKIVMTKTIGERIVEEWRMKY